LILNLCDKKSFPSQYRNEYLSLKTSNAVKGLLNETDEDD